MFKYNPTSRIKPFLRVAEGGCLLVEICSGISVFQYMPPNRNKFLFDHIFLHLISIPRLAFNALQVSNTNVSPILAPAFLAAETLIRSYALFSRLTLTQLDKMGRFLEAHYVWRRLFSSAYFT